MPTPSYGEWTEADLLGLVRDGARERAGFEYKRCGALRLAGNKTKQNIVDEVSKDLSAMANADGGVFVYGVRERDEQAVGLDDGFDGNDFQPDWLENVVLSTITPRVEGLLIHPIPLTTHAPGRFAYLVRVERSSRGCQAHDKHYYRRRNFRNDILDDWEVRELLNRSAHPIVSLEIGYKLRDRDASRHVYHLFVTVKNTGFKRTQDLMAEIEMPKEFVAGTNLTANNRPLQPNGFVIREVARSSEPVRRWIFRSTQPLFPQESIELANDTVHNELTYHVTSDLHRVLHRSEVAVRWRLFADDMLPKEGAKPLRELSAF